MINFSTILLNPTVSLHQDFLAESVINLDHNDSCGLDRRIRTTQLFEDRVYKLVTIIDKTRVARGNLLRYGSCGLP
jgi:hypothetical protein